MQWSQIPFQNCISIVAVSNRKGTYSFFYLVTSICATISAVAHSKITHTYSAHIGAESFLKSHVVSRIILKKIKCKIKVSRKKNCEITCGFKCDFRQIPMWHILKDRTQFIHQNTRIKLIESCRNTAIHQEKSFRFNKYRL